MTHLFSSNQAPAPLAAVGGAQRDARVKRRRNTRAIPNRSHRGCSGYHLRHNHVDPTADLGIVMSEDYQRRNRGPSCAPMKAQSTIAAQYHMAMNGTESLAQLNA
jgi:hypothetical protein